MPPGIEISNLTYVYPNGKKALSDICLNITAAEKFALVGANGAGKSTLLLHLNGILRGNGKIRIMGKEINKRNLGDIRAIVGIVFQNPDDQLFSSTVFEDVAYGPLYQGMDELTIREKVHQALSAVQMSDAIEENPFHLSAGEKKRVAIATVLSMHPQILVFDEPTSGLDPRARRELITLLANLPQTMVIATHDLEIVRALASRTVVLNQGSIVADGLTASILDDNNLLFTHGLK